MRTYRIEIDGEVRFASRKDGSGRIFYLGGSEVDFDDGTFHVIRDADGFYAYKNNQRYSVFPITLANVREILPDSYRTFDSVKSLDDYVQREVFSSYGSYSPNFEEEDSDELYLVSNPTLRSLTLVKESGDSLFVRSDGEWIEVDEDDDLPELEGKTLPIHSQDTYSAIMSWDSEERSGRSPSTIFHFVR